MSEEAYAQFYFKQILRNQETIMTTQADIVNELNAVKAVQTSTLAAVQALQAAIVTLQQEVANAPVSPDLQAAADAVQAAANAVASAAAPVVPPSPPSP